MWKIRMIASRLRGLLIGRAADRELSDEIDEHVRQLAERYVRQGMAPEEAAFAARRQFGGVTRLREDHRDARRLPWIDHSVRDVLFGLRLLRKNLGFSIIAIAVLALGIGANTA